MKQKTFCLFCQSPKLTYTKNHANFINWVLSGFMAIILSFIVFQDLDFRALVFVSLFIGLSEIFIHMRWRLSIICMECGFDPIIYKNSPARAALKVKSTLANREKNPQNYFKPALKIPVQINSAKNKKRIVTNASPEVARIRLAHQRLKHKQDHLPTPQV